MRQHHLELRDRGGRRPAHLYKLSSNGKPTNSESARWTQHKKTAWAHSGSAGKAKLSSPLLASKPPLDAADNVERKIIIVPLVPDQQSPDSGEAHLTSSDPALERHTEEVELALPAVADRQ